jgi:regulatory protein
VSGDDQVFRDAEAWLADRGVEREPIRVRSTPADSEAPKSRSRGSGMQHQDRATDPVDDDDRSAPPLGEAVAKAVAYARRATARTPLSEGRLRRKLADRDYPEVVIEEAIGRARTEGLVDDVALAAALVREGREKGHAPLRIRTDLARRELPDGVIDAAVAEIGDRDEEVAALDVATKRAAQLRSVDAETAYRRLAGYLARRGYTDGLSRKVAREAVFNDREQQRIAER